MRTVKKIISLSTNPLVYVMYCAVGGGGDLALAIKIANYLQPGYRVCLIENTIGFFKPNKSHVLSKLQSSSGGIPNFYHDSVPPEFKKPNFVICLPVIQNEAMFKIIVERTSEHGFRDKILPIQMNCKLYYLPDGAMTLGFGLDSKGIQSSGLCFTPSDNDPPTHETFLRGFNAEFLDKLEHKWLRDYLKDKSGQLLFSYNHLAFNSVRALLVMLSSLRDFGDVTAVIKTYDNSTFSQFPLSLARSYDLSLKFFDQLSWYKDILRILGVAKVVFSCPDQIDQVMDVSESGKTVYLCDPFPLASQDFGTLLDHSVPIISCTGLNSFEEVISKRKLPLYEVLFDNRKLWDDFCLEALPFDPDKIGLVRYFELTHSLVKNVKYGYDQENLSPDGFKGWRDQIPSKEAGCNATHEEIERAKKDILELGELIHSPLLWEQWARFSEHLIVNRNAYDHIQEKIKAMLSPH